MGWRSVVVSQGATLRYAHQALIIEQGETASVPLEDISVLVLDSAEVLLTSRLLLECAAAGIVVLTVGRDHLPNGALLPFLPHSRPLKTLNRQLNLSRPAAKRGWRGIVQRKIRNQGRCLDFLDRPGGTTLARLAEEVRSGDLGNQEAIAAQRYFPALFGEGFCRPDARFWNAALNYGYAVLRAALGRTLVVYGFLPVLGLHHCNEQNAFNLADDLLEPFRPVVDLCVAQSWPGEEGRPLSPADKAVLVGLLHRDIGLEEDTLTVLAAMEATVQSLGRFYAKRDADLLRLPVLLPLAAPPAGRVPE